LNASTLAIYTQCTGSKDLDTQYSAYGAYPKWPEQDSQHSLTAVYAWGY